jgi:hypothetical protein
LKEKLELEKVKKKDGRTRVTLKPIEDQLTFDKVGVKTEREHVQTSVHVQRMHMHISVGICNSAWALRKR